MAVRVSSSSLGRWYASLAKCSSWAGSSIQAALSMAVTVSNWAALGQAVRLISAYWGATPNIVVSWPVAWPRCGRSSHLSTRMFSP